MTEPTTIRPMTAEEVTLLVQWADQEGWNPGHHDAASFFAADPDGFLAVEVDGQLAGGGAIVRHNPRFGFMGLFILRPEFRGWGLGHQLWFARRDRLRERLEPNGTIGLDAVAAMIPFYARGGFQPFTRHCRYEGHPPAAHSVDLSTVVDLEPVDRDEIRAFDRRCFPGPRDRFLTAWLDQPGTHQLAVVDGQRLQGYCIMRPCGAGWKVGPLFADRRSVAELLLQRCFELAGTGPLYVDAPENNPDALRLCEDLGMQQVFECTRMYLGPVPELDHEKIFGVTTLEVG